LLIPLITVSLASRAVGLSLNAKGAGQHFLFWSIGTKTNSKIKIIVANDYLNPFQHRPLGAFPRWRNLGQPKSINLGRAKQYQDAKRTG